MKDDIMKDAVRNIIVQAINGNIPISNEVKDIFEKCNYDVDMIMERLTVDDDFWSDEDLKKLIKDKEGEK